TGLPPADLPRRLRVAPGYRRGSESGLALVELDRFRSFGGTKRAAPPNRVMNQWTRKATWRRYQAEPASGKSSALRDSTSSRSCDVGSYIARSLMVSPGQ